MKKNCHRVTMAFQPFNDCSRKLFSDCQNNFSDETWMLKQNNFLLESNDSTNFLHYLTNHNAMFLFTVKMHYFQEKNW